MPSPGIIIMIVITTMAVLAVGLTENITRANEQWKNEEKKKLKS